jgi:hypothetical protein
VICVLEGPDLAGKTTLARKLAEAQGPGKTIVLNYGAPEISDPFLEYEAGFLGRLPADPGILVICDRLAAGETVYGPVLRGRSRLTRGGLLHCEMLYEALGAVRLMLMPSLAVLLARYRERGDLLIDEGELAGIREAYAALAPRFNYTQLHDAAGTEAGPLLRLAEERAQRAADVQAGAPGYVGPLYPAVVFAGDIRAGIPANDPYRHAFTPAGFGAARFLMGSLASYSRRVLRSTGIMNTLEEGMDLAKADEILGRPRYVALGHLADARLRQAGITQVTWIPHPAYTGRFRKRTEAEYGQDLMQAAGLLSTEDGKA